MKSLSVTIPMKATELYFLMVLFFLQGALQGSNLRARGEFLKYLLIVHGSCQVCDHSSESSREALSCGALYYAVQLRWL